MSYSTLIKDNTTIVCANLTFSDGSNSYVEMPMNEDDLEEEYEQLLIDRFLVQFHEYDSEGNALPLDFTVTSVTAP